jgi:tRNA pseudouridine55 synthase
MNKPLLSSGWLVLDKPLDISSSQALNSLRRYFKPLKVGHAGTLDPLASGILPVAIGEATKTIQFCMDKEKEYQFTVTWGFERTTDDLEGEIVKTSNLRPLVSEIEQALQPFRGHIMQTPPIFSAIKIAGKRAYDLARNVTSSSTENNDANIEMQPRPIYVKSLEILRHDEDSCTFRVACGKGTYVRSLARDIGRLLGCYGYVSALRRTRVGAFGTENSPNKIISLELLKNIIYEGRLEDYLYPIDAVLDDIPAAEITDSQVTLIRNGRELNLNEASRHNGLIALQSSGNLVAIGSLSGGVFRSQRVFNN